MRDRLPVALSAAALAVALVGATPLGHAAQTVVDFARNADKVDGKHAVAFGTAVGKRKGKLVADQPSNRSSAEQHHLESASCGPG